jgi:hypothetical protein
LGLQALADANQLLEAQVLPPDPGNLGRLNPTKTNFEGYLDRAFSFAAPDLPEIKVGLSSGANPELVIDSMYEREDLTASLAAGGDGAGGVNITQMMAARGIDRIDSPDFAAAGGSLINDYLRDDLARPEDLGTIDPYGREVDEEPAVEDGSGTVTADLGLLEEEVEGDSGGVVLTESAMPTEMEVLWGEKTQRFQFVSTAGPTAQEQPLPNSQKSEKELLKEEWWRAANPEKVWLYEQAQHHRTKAEIESESFVGDSAANAVSKYEQVINELRNGEELTLDRKLTLAIAKVSVIDAKLAAFLESTLTIKGKTLGSYLFYMEAKHYYKYYQPVGLSGVPQGPSGLKNTEPALALSDNGITLYAMDGEYGATIDEIFYCLMDNFVWNATEFQKEYVNKAFSGLPEDYDLWIKLNNDQFDRNAKLAAQLTLQLLDSSVGLLPGADLLLLGDSVVSRDYYADILGAEGADARTRGLLQGVILDTGAGTAGAIGGVALRYRRGKLVKTVNGGGEKVVDLRQVMAEYQRKIEKGDVEGAWETLRQNGLAPTSSLRGTQFSQNVRRYMDAIEQHTGFRLHPSQRARLADDLRTTNYSRLSSEAGRVHRRGFTQRVREAQIAEWERQTGQAWPRYTEDLLNAEGKVLRKAGDAYDAHHVIENIYGGPHEWWNLTPARFPDQHQGGIHLEAIMETLFQ